MQAFSSCSEKGGCSLSWFTDFSLLWLPSWSKAISTRASGVLAFWLSSCSSWTVELRLSSCAQRLLLLFGMFFPGQGSNVCSLHWQVDFYSLYHQGSPILFDFLNIFKGIYSRRLHSLLYIFPLQHLMSVFIRKLSFIFDKNHSVEVPFT